VILCAAKAESDEGRAKRKPRGEDGERAEDGEAPPPSKSEGKQKRRKKAKDGEDGAIGGQNEKALFSGDEGGKPKKVSVSGHGQNLECPRIVSERSARVGRKRVDLRTSLLVVLARTDDDEVRRHGALLDPRL
jgi:hypothetical protein